MNQTESLKWQNIYNAAREEYNTHYEQNFKTYEEEWALVNTGEAEYTVDQAGNYTLVKTPGSLISQSVIDQVNAVKNIGIEIADRAR
jgi:hypothetical protein